MPLLPTNPRVRNPTAALAEMTAPVARSPLLRHSVSGTAAARPQSQDPSALDRKQLLRR